MKRTFLCSLVVALLVSLGQLAHAQELKPIITVSANSLQELIADGKFIDGLANDGKPKDVWQMVPAFTQGIDGTKPAGGVLASVGPEMRGYLFVPITNFEKALDIAAQAMSAEVEDGPNGTKLIGQVAATEEDGYAFFAQSPDHLQNLPKPAKILGDRIREYDVSVTINLQNIPILYRQMGIGLIRQGIEDGLQRAEDETDAQFQMRKEVAQQQIKMMEQLLDEVDSVTVGTSIDRTAKKFFFDYAITARAGTSTAQQFASMKDAQTRFSTLVAPEAPIRLNMATTITDAATLERATAQLDAYRQAVMSMIDESEDINSDEERAIFKELADEGLGIVKGLYKEGRFDVAMALTKDGDGPFRLLGGMHVGNAKELEAYVKKVLTMAMESEEDFPPVKFNADEHKGAKIHVVTLPVKEEEIEDVRKVFGADPKLLLAFSDNAAWMALGGDSMNALKSVIENSDPNNLKKVHAFEASMALIPFMKLASEVDQNPIAGQLMEMVKTGTDHLSVIGEGIGNGVRYRLQADEGVLKLISFGISQAAENVPLGGAEEEEAPTF